MKITRLYTGPDGKSHFEDVDIPLLTYATGELQSESMSATGVILRETSGNFDLGWHNAPRRQLVITLAGAGEIELGDGTRRRFGPGDIMLAEDVTGQGHRTRAVNQQPRTSMFVTLD
jgi:quercetin dioxygenase-like cupin family protein